MKLRPHVSSSTDQRCPYTSRFRSFRRRAVASLLSDPLWHRLAAARAARIVRGGGAVLAGGAGRRDGGLCLRRLGRRNMAGRHACARRGGGVVRRRAAGAGLGDDGRSEEHTSELQSLMRISYAVFCLKKKNTDI